MTTNDYLSGIRQTGPVATISVAANAGAQTIYTRATGFLGTRSQKIRKITISNHGAGNTFVHFGTGAPGAVVDIMPSVMSLNNLDIELNEEDIPGAETFANLMAYVETLVAAGTVVVQVTVEEIGA